MVSTRKRMEGVGHKKSDGKGKRVRDDDYRKDLKTFVEGKDSMAKSSKQGKLLMVKSEVEDKKLGRHTNKKAKSLVCIDSDFEGSAKKEGKEDAVEAHKRKIVPRQKQLKIWELFYEEHHRNFYAKVIYWCEMEVPNIIKNKLSVVQLDKFKLTCFGKFLDFGQPQMFSQIIHHALIREVYQRDSGEMWFIFGERRVRFGLPEFCLISGLNWQGDEDIGSFKGIENLLVEKFFQNEVLTRSSIGRIYRSACFDDDDEAVRMSIIFLVFNFILATVSDNYVDEALFNFLSYGDVASYPWGKVAFEQTKNSLSLAVKGHVKKDKYGGVIYNFYSDSYCKSYKLSGLPYVFQVFLFETIPTLKVRGFCIDDNDSEFRLFRWRELGKAPKNEKLNDLVFGSGQLIIQNLVPTEDEKLRLDLGGFYFFSGSDSGAKRSDSEVESSRKVKDLMFSISDVEKIIDERVKPLEGKVMEVKKEIENLSVEFKDQLQGFRIQICRDIKKMFRKQLYGKFSYLKRRNVTVIDDGDGDDDDDVMKVDDDNVVVDDVMKVEDDVVIEVGDISKQFHGSNTADVGGVGVIKFEEVDAKIENKNDNLNSYGKEIVVYTPRRVLINVENEKVEKINEIPRFDILSQCSGQEIGVFTPIEGSKSEAPDRSMLDDMVLTTQDLLHCVEVEKSATNPLELLVIGLARRMALPGAHRDGRELRIHESLDELSTDLAEYIAELSEVSVKERGAFAIALSGGSLISFMGKLCQAPYNKTVDWAKWHIFWADERVVAKNHVDSNYKLAKDTLLSKVPIVPSHVHSINDSLSAEEAADDYEFVIRQLVRTRVVGVSDISDSPMFDLILLGMGSDGHVASLFPNHSVLDEKDKWVTFIIDSPKPPPERITFSLPVINSSANVALVVTGSSKAQVVHLAIDDAGSECPSLPAKMIQPTKGKLVWFLDKPAASKLDDGEQFSG